MVKRTRKFKPNKVKNSSIYCGHCGYVWTYKGKGLYFATCPQCLGKVKIGTVTK